MHVLAPAVRLLAPGFLAVVAWADVVTIGAAKDNTLYQSGTGALSNGKGDQFFSGITAQNKIRRALLQFDVAAAVPAGSTIQSVRLTLQLTNTIANTENVSLHRALADWGEGASNAPGQEGSGGAATTGDATWIHTFYNGSFWATAGGDYDPSASATLGVAFNGTYTWGSTAAMVADVQTWLDTPGANFGWLIRHDDEVTMSTAKRFASRSHFDTTARPALEIDYTPPGGCTGANYCTANPNSTGNAAAISFTGSCSITVNSFTLISQPVPNQSFLFFFGPNQIQVPFGNGFLCVGGGLTRITPPMTASNNTATRTLDLVGLGMTPSTQNFQCWFRDPMGGGSFFNTSDAIQVVFVP
jgi:hypothetical protein